MRNWLPKAWRKSVVTALPRLGVERLETRETPAAFTAGNLVVFVAAASANNTTGSIVELDTVTASQSAVQTIAIEGASGTDALRFSGSATSTGYLSRTNDGSLLTFNGGNTTTTTVNVNTITTRGVGTLDADGVFDLAATYTGTSGQQTRSATSLNNADYFIADQAGIYTNGATAASPTANVRAIKAFGGTVYTGQASSTTTTIQVNTVSAATGGSITGLPGLSNLASHQDFYLIRSGDNGGTFDVLYVVSATSNTAGLLSKFSFVDSDANGSLDTWTANGTHTTAFGGFGLAAQDDGDGALLYVSTGQGAATANSVLAVTDDAGYNATISVTTANNVTLYTAATGTIVKGVAFAPTNIALAPATLPDGTTGTAYSETLTASGGVSDYFYALAAGDTLPAGLTLDDATGEIAGTPTAAGSTTFSVVVTDATGATFEQEYTLVVANGSNAAPVVTPSTGATTFTENAAATAIDATLTVTDDGTTLSGGTVTITNFVTGQDALEFTDQNGISGSYSAGVLTLTGSASVADYQTALRSVRYANASDDPTAGDRSVEFVVSDGSASSSAATKTVTVVAVNDEPTLTATPVGGTFTEGGSAVLAFSGTTASTVEAGQSFVALTLTVSGLADGTAEVLTIDGSDVTLTAGTSLTTSGNGFSVNVSVSGGTATVSVSKSGGVSASLLAGVVDTLAYRNTSEAPTAGNRVVTLTAVQDSGGGSDTATLSVAATVTVTPVNDAPVVANVDGDSQTYLQGGAAVALDVGADATVTDADSADFDGGELIAGVTTGGQTTDVLGVRNQGTGAGLIGVSGSTVSFGGVTIGTLSGGTGGSNLVVSLNADATPAAVQALLRNLTLLPDAATSTATRAVTLAVTDGDGGSSNTSMASVAVDTVPQVLSITRNNPATTNAGSVSWTVTFSQAVGGVDAADFARTATGTLTVSSASVTASGGGSTATVWVYTANGVSGDGTLDLDFSAPTGVTPAASAAFDGPLYTIDQTAPTATIATGPAAFSPSGSATFTFSGSDPTAGGVSSGVASFQYSLDGAAFAAAASPLTLSGLADGSHTVLVRSTDAAGNVGSPASYSFTVDTTPPTVTSFANTSAPPVVTGVAFTYTVTFGEDIDATTLTSASFSNAGTAGVTFGTPTETGPNTGVFTITVTPTTTGTIILRVAAGSAADRAGNTLAAAATDPTTVNVVNVAPTATFANGGAVNEGSAGSVGFSGADDLSPLDDAAGFRYAYDFDNNGTFEVGDGTFANSSTSATATVPATFLTDGNGTRTVRAVVIDQGGAAREYFTTIGVNNVAPTVALTGGAGVNEGTAYTLTVGATADPGTDTVTQFVVNWGDGTSTTYATGGAKTHTYADNGTYAVSVDLTDEDGTFVNRGNVVTATVSNVAPTITGFSVPGGGVGGIPVGVSASATDPAGASDPLTFTWTVLKNGSPFASGSGAAFAFTPDAAGSYAVTLVVSDDDGGTATRSAVVAVTIPYRPTLAAAVGGTVRVYDPAVGTTATLTPYPGFAGGLTVATADLNGDGFEEVVTGAGPGGGPHVKVFDGRTLAEVASFFAYAPSFGGGVFVAAGGGVIATGAGAGGSPHVRTFDRFGNERSSFFAFAESFRGGVRVAVGDLDANGVPEVVAATGPGVPAAVRVFANGSTNVATSIAPFDAFRGGAFVAVGGGRIAVGADAGGSPHVKTFTPAGSETASFYAFAESFRGGVRVAFTDDDANGTVELVAAAGPGGGPNVRAFTVSPFGLLSDRQAGDLTDARGVFVG